MTYQNMEMFVSEILEKNSRLYPNDLAIVCNKETISHQELNKCVSKIISLLKTKNLSSDTLIGLRFQNPINYCIFYLALFKLQTAQTPLPPKDSKENLIHTIEKMGISLIIQDFDIDDTLSVPIIKINNDFSMQTHNIKNVTPNSNIPKGTSVVILGSGTTGDKKVICRSSEDYVQPLSPYIHNFDMKPKDRYYVYSAIYYPFARRWFLIALMFGMTTILTRRPPQDLVSFCRNKKIHHIGLTASQAKNFLLKNSYSSTVQNLKLPLLKSCMLSTSLVTETVRNAIVNTITNNLYIGYGSNEFGFISMANPEDISKHPGTVGRALPNVSLKIMNNEGKECATGEVGNIVVSSKNMTAQYYQDTEANSNTFKNQQCYTGDLGHLTEDGNLIFEGRTDDMMIFTGVNIYPREIESILESHPNVIESAVFPINASQGEHIPFACVSVNKKTTEKELLQWCESKLGWKRPQRILFAKELPKNAMGKTLKKELTKITHKFLQKKNKLY